MSVTIPARKRTKRARSAVNPWIRNAALSSSTVSEKTSTGKTSAEAGNKELKKCAHCEATETPQWREGPMGRSTLCNACGVRYRSGRLFPEYRPAASPTFVPTLHSNSHRKVAEIRRKAAEIAAEEGKEEEMVEVPVLLVCTIEDIIL